MIKLTKNPISNYHFNLTEENEFKKSNIFSTIPKGIVIFDSYNNPFFPLTYIDVDDSKFSYTNIKNELKQKGWLAEFMPWHYWVEYVNNEYIVLQSRPLHYKTQLPGFEQYICICLAGNSKSDIYNKKLYKSLAHLIMNSLRYIPGWKINTNEQTILLNLGKHFDENQLIKYLR